MATVIRFARHGTKKKPYFRIVVQNHQSARDGRFIEHIGAYAPTKGEASLSIERDRLEYWLSVGAQLSDSVKNRLKVKMREWKQATVAPVAEAPAPKAKKAASKGKEA